MWSRSLIRVEREDMVLVISFFLSAGCKNIVLSLSFARWTLKKKDAMRKTSLFAYKKTLVVLADKNQLTIIQSSVFSPG